MAKVLPISRWPDKELPAPLEDGFPSRQGTDVGPEDYEWLTKSYNQGSNFTSIVVQSQRADFEKGVPKRNILETLANTNCYRDLNIEDDDQKAIGLLQRLVVGGQQTFKTIGVAVATARSISAVQELVPILKWFNEKARGKENCAAGLTNCPCKSFRVSYSWWLQHKLCDVRKKYLEQNPLCEDSLEWMYKFMKFPFLHLPLELREQVGTTMTHIGRSLCMWESAKHGFSTTVDSSVQIYGYFLPEPSDRVTRQSLLSSKDHRGFSLSHHIAAASRVNRQISKEFRRMFYPQRYFEALIDTKHIRPKHDLGALQLFGDSYADDYVTRGCQIAASIQNWTLIVSLDVVFTPKHRPAHTEHRNLTYKRLFSGIWTGCGRARKSVETFSTFLQTQAPATRTIKVEMQALDNPVPKKYIKYILEPLIQLRGIERVDMEVKRQFESHTNMTNTLAALIESDWKDFDLKETQEWSHLKEAARRSLFVR